MALYNEERPKTFNELLGQDKNVRIFKQILTSNKLPNAFLFIGSRGTGKTSSARVFARALNCANPHEDGSPCNECDSCKEILADASMDVIELDAASHGGVDDVHEIIKMAQFTPIHKKKILIVDEVHMLSNAAFNALLKTIEEPPTDVVFIFATTEEHKVPATIISRCRRFVFERISDDVIEGKLKEVCSKKGVPFEDEALGIIARAAKGGMRDALSILEQFLTEPNVATATVKETLGIADEDAIFNILKAVSTGDTSNAIKVFRNLYKMGKNLDVVLKSLIDGTIDAVYTMQTGEEVNATALYKEGIKSLISCSTQEKLISYIEKLTKVYEVSRKDADMSFAIEMTLMQMVNYTSELESVKARLSEVEGKLAKVLNGHVAIMPAAICETAIEGPVAESTTEADSNVVNVNFGGIDIPVEINDAEFEKADEIPFDASGDFSFENNLEMGETISLASIMDSEEKTVEESAEEDNETVDEAPVIEPAADLFSLGSAWLI